MAKQELNSLERFRKRSARLVLEEHGHCEVPAGCGGVVLRWRTPHAITCPVSLVVYSPVPVVCRVDGAEPRTSLVSLAVGRHAITFLFTDVQPSACRLLFAAVQELRQPLLHLPPGLADRALKLVTADDGTWKHAPGPPQDAWGSPDFDDAGWPALVRAETPEPAQGQPGGWPFRRCVEFGAVCLGPPPGLAGPVSLCVRRAFDVAAPLGPDPAATP